MKLETRDIAKMAMYIAMYVALDLFSSRILAMPNGGSLGLGTVVLMVASFDLGIVKALLVTFGGLVISFLFDPPFFNSLIQFVLEYFVAFGLYALAKGLKTDRFLLTSTILPNLGRFIIHVFAGMVYFGTNLEGSVAYNAPYMLATTIAGVILVPLLVYKLQPLLNKNSR